MRARGRVGRLFIVMVVGTLVMISQAQAGISCHKITAKGVGQDLGGGATEAHIIGGGLLHGTTDANFTTAGSPPVFSIAGTVTFTTNKATLTITVTGTFNVVTGEFMAFGPVTEATGKLTGATGTLLFEGAEDLSTGMFAEDVTGVICVNLAP